MPELNTFSFYDLMARVEEATGGVVNFHKLLPLADIPDLKLTGEMGRHHGPFCEFVKLQGNLAKCLSEKQKSIQRARAGRPFEHICRYGIWDLVYPIVFEGETVGVLYLGSLRAGRALKSVNGKIYSGTPIAPVSAENKSQLRHWGKFLANFVILALSRWRRRGDKTFRQKKNEFYARSAHAFIHNYYREDIRIGDLTAQLSCHPNYLGKMIQQACGKSFRRLLTEFRIEKAKPLLVMEQYSVTDAAFACGFTDPNYFSAVFHQLTGCTPKEFRKNNSRYK